MTEPSRGRAKNRLMGMLSLFFVSVPDARLVVGGILQFPQISIKKSEPISDLESTARMI